MKQGIHPVNYRPVVLQYKSNDDIFVTKHTAKTNDTLEY